MDVIVKSTKLVRIDDKGNISRGKYIFLIIASFVTSELLALVKAPAKKVQNTKPISTKRGYGSSPEGILARFPKNIVKINVWESGWKIAQRNPSAVCLYLTFRSRHVKI